MLLQLSTAAHERAVQYGGLTPAERQEFRHLPMKKLADGTPYFDEFRRRPDQIEETIERLQRITGRAERGTVREKIGDFMEAYGRFGQRISDIMEAVEASKPIVLRYLRDFEQAGLIQVKQTPTRKGGSPRKVYQWVGSEADYGEMETIGEGPDALRVKTDHRMASAWDPGVIHHGSSVGRLQGCDCQSCSWALDEAWVAEERSAARRAGGSGFTAGLELRARRRVAAQREFERIAAIGLARRAAV